MKTPKKAAMPMEKAMPAMDKAMAKPKAAPAKKPITSTDQLRDLSKKMSKKKASY